MSNSKLPQPRRVSALTQTSGNGFLTLGSLSIAGGIAAYAFLNSVVLAVIAILIGSGFLITRQLVRKSLELSSPAASANTNTQNWINEVSKQVSKCKFLEHMEIEGIKAAEQGKLLEHQYNSVLGVLKVKFDVTEITFSRYETALNELCLAIGENLLHIKSELENLNGIATAARDELWANRRSAVQNELESNQKALTELALLHASLNDITTKERNRDQLESSMQQLRELTERAKKYSRM